MDHKVSTRTNVAELGASACVAVVGALVAAALLCEEETHEALGALLWGFFSTADAVLVGGGAFLTGKIRRKVVFFGTDLAVA